MRYHYATPATMKDRAQNARDPRARLYSPRCKRGKVAKSQAETRRDRLAAALRENLKRRKAHKRGEELKRPQSGPETHADPSGDALSRLKPSR